MPNNPSTHEDKIRSFWDRYVKMVRDSGVKPPFDRWMVLRAEQYIAAHPTADSPSRPRPTWTATSPNWAATRV